jgi:type I site-specific restriction-modification system R (restriction) subunit
VLFVVDRKDLDRQTREEFNKFQENCVEENTNTYTLVERLLSTDYADKVIVTTIQKLGLALDGANKNNYKEQLKPLASQRIVFIFDECHRSQFGENNKAIQDKSISIGVFFYAIFLKFVKFFTRLAVKVFSIHHKQHFMNILIFF